jgi:hypothetical protein
MWQGKVSSIVGVSMDNRYGSKTLHQCQELGQLLLEEGLLSTGQMSVVLYEQEQTNLPLEEILMSHGWIEHKDLQRVMLKQCRANLKKLIDPSA